MGAMLEVMRSRLGVTEIRGKQHNPMILEMFKDAGRPDVVTDEEAWCSAACCSAAKRSDMPMPPVNVNLMAKSWLTWGVGIEKTAAAIKAALEAGFDVVAVWPRGDPNGSQGHVNIVEEVCDFDRAVICIGGNQSTSKGADAVTRAKPRKISEAVGFRRGVPATVSALREAGSTTIKRADTKEKLGIVAIMFTPIVKGIETLFGKIDLPDFASLPDGLTWWQSVLGGANAVFNYAMSHPFLAVTLFAGLGLWALSRSDKKGRVAEHAAGIPIAAEVHALGAA